MVVTGEHAEVLVSGAIAAVQRELRVCPGPSVRQQALTKLRNSLERRLGDPLTPADVAVLVSVRREYETTPLS